MEPRHVVELRNEYGTRSYIGKSLIDIHCNNAKTVKKVFIGQKKSAISYNLVNQFSYIFGSIDNIIERVKNASIAFLPDVGNYIFELYQRMQNFDFTADLNTLSRVLCRILSLMQDFFGLVKVYMLNIGIFPKVDIDYIDQLDGEEEEDASNDRVDTVSSEDVQNLRQAEEEISDCEAFIRKSGSYTIQVIKMLARQIIFVAKGAVGSIVELVETKLEYTGYMFGYMAKGIESVLSKYKDEPAMKKLLRDIIHLVFFSTSAMDLFAKSVSYGYYYTQECIRKLKKDFYRILSNLKESISEFFSEYTAVSKPMVDLLKYIRSVSLWEKLSEGVKVSLIFVSKTTKNFLEWLTSSVEIISERFSNFFISFNIPLTEIIYKYVSKGFYAFNDETIMDRLYSLLGNITRDDKEDIAEVVLRFADSKQTKRIQDSLKDLSKEREEFMLRQRKRAVNNPTVAVWEELGARWELSSRIASEVIGLEVDESPETKKKLAEQVLGMNPASELRMYNDALDSLDSALYSVLKKYIKVQDVVPIGSKVSDEVQLKKDAFDIDCESLDRNYSLKIDDSLLNQLKADDDVTKQLKDQLELFILKQQRQECAKEKENVQDTETKTDAQDALAKLIWHQAVVEGVGLIAGIGSIGWTFYWIYIKSQMEKYDKFNKDYLIKNRPESLMSSLLSSTSNTDSSWSVKDRGSVENIVLSTYDSVINNNKQILENLHLQQSDVKSMPAEFQYDSSLVCGLTKCTEDSVLCKRLGCVKDGELAFISKYIKQGDRGKSLDTLIDELRGRIEKEIGEYLQIDMETYNEWFITKLGQSLWSQASKWMRALGLFDQIYGSIEKIITGVSLATAGLVGLVVVTSIANILSTTIIHIWYSRELAVVSSTEGMNLPPSVSVAVRDNMIYILKAAGISTGLLVGLGKIVIDMQLLEIQATKGFVDGVFSIASTVGSIFSLVPGSFIGTDINQLTSNGVCDMCFRSNPRFICSNCMNYNTGYCSQKCLATSWRKKIHTC